MKRQVVLDTETTGLSHQEGHRIIEIGCIELVNRQLTQKQYHVYLNPEREVDAGAFRVHGISTDFLKDKPKFADIADEFWAFIEDAELIIHNAVFDMGFLGAEFDRLNGKYPIKKLSVFDTLIHARAKHKGARNNLDALCKRYKIDNTNRTLHGALLDAEILAAVYLAMTGGQIDLFAQSHTAVQTTSKAFKLNYPKLSSRSPVITATQDEMTAHEAFVKALKIDKWQEA